METHGSTRKKPVEAVIALFGTAAGRQRLLEHGVTDWDLRRALADGRIRRMGRAVYALPEANDMDVHLIGNQAVLDCYSLARQMGLWVLNDPRNPHVATAHGRPVPGCRVHRNRGRPSLWDMMRHCLKCGTDLEVLCVVESAVVLGKCTVVDLRNAFTKRGDARMLRIIRMIDPQSQSIAETCGRYHLRIAGYNVQGQASIPGMGHLDLLVEGVLGVENDGEKFHNTAIAWAEDLRRLNVLTIRGVPTLHIKASDVLYRPKVMLDLVRMALRTLGAAPR